MVDVKTKLLLLTTRFFGIHEDRVQIITRGTSKTDEDAVYPDGHASVQYFNVVELSIAVKKSGALQTYFS